MVGFTLYPGVYVADTYIVFRAFIASPGDVPTERHLAEETITKISRTVRDTVGAAIEAHKWEHLPPLTPKLAEERLQDVINREIEQCHFFILILNRRWGSVEPGHTLSNTEREIEAILNAYERDPTLQILAYFRELEPNADPGDQEVKVRQLRTRLETLGLAYRRYRDPSDFERLLTHDLYHVLLRIHLDPFKKQVFKNFWRFGETERPSDPRVAMFYPPINRGGLSDGGNPEYWLRRLTTQVAFEDYKAIQKIDRAFRFMGFSNYRVFPSTDAPPEHPWLNRVSLCLPRNRLGLEILRERSSRRFNVQSADRPPVNIQWRSGTRDIVVYSPMAEYLRRQRTTMEIRGEWHGQLSRIIAKDFAVLARLQRRSGQPGQPLWDYFVSGIRGVGTWGAAWYVDHEFRQLQRFTRTEDIQLLLEITFRDGRIFKVTDVSDQPQEYFNHEMDVAAIDENIREFRGGWSAV